MVGQSSAAGISANYNDLSGLAQINQLAKVSEGSAFEEIGRQFESLLVHNMLKGMRSANSVWAKDGLLSSQDVEFYQGMLDEQLSLSLTQGDGLGLARQFASETQRSYGLNDTSERTKQGANTELGNVDGRFIDIRDVPRQQVLQRATDATTQAGTQSAAQHSRPSLSASSRTASADALGSDSAERKQDKFIAQLMPYAQRAAAELNVKPELLVAQAALETGWGEHIIQKDNGERSFNLFGIKAHANWQGETADVVTHEYVGMRKANVVATFRAYDSYEASFKDYVGFVKNNPRYEGALAHQSSSASYPELLQKAGYATDPQYAEKIHSIAQRISERATDASNQAAPLSVLASASAAL